jgi:hypothetical protein
VPDFEQDVDDGFRSALERWGPEIGVTIDDSVVAPLEEPRYLALAVLNDYEAHDRYLGRPGVTMFAEWVAVAAMVRVAHNEPPLQRFEIDAFLPAATEILNTAFCRPPSGERHAVGGFWPTGDDAQEREATHLPESEAGASS